MTRRIAVVSPVTRALRWRHHRLCTKWQSVSSTNEDAARSHDRTEDGWCGCGDEDDDDGDDDDTDMAAPPPPPPPPCTCSALIFSHVSPSAFMKWSSTEPERGVGSAASSLLAFSRLQAAPRDFSKWSSTHPANTQRATLDDHHGNHKNSHRNTHSQCSSHVCP